MKEQKPLIQYTSHLFLSIRFQTLLETGPNVQTFEKDSLRIDLITSTCVV